MPLSKPKQEGKTEKSRGRKLSDRQRAFVSEYLIDLNGTQAVLRAGHNSKPTSAAVTASRLLRNANVAEAIDKGLQERGGTTRTRIVDELAKIAFSDIRKAVEWHGDLVREKDNPDGGDVLVIKEIFSNHVRLIDSAQLDADTAAAIAEVKQSPTGGLSIKFHDKLAALDKLGRALNLFKERVEITGKDGSPLTPVINLFGRPESPSASEAVDSVPHKRD